jgi:hypothetical protein
VAHLRPARYLVSAFCFLILVVFQSVTFAVITSDFCDDADCNVGRGAGFSIAAVFCFFFSGLLFLVMRDRPRDEDTAAPAVALDAEAAGKGAGTGAHDEANPVDMEQPIAEHVEGDQPTEQVVNDGIADAQEIEVLDVLSSDPFVGSPDALFKRRSPSKGT